MACVEASVGEEALLTKVALLEEMMANMTESHAKEITNMTESHAKEMDAAARKLAKTEKKHADKMQSLKAKHAKKIESMKKKYEDEIRWLKAGIGHLRGEIKVHKAEKETLQKAIKKLEAALKRAEKKLAFYESSNQSSSSISLYNEQRKKFREERGENPFAGPGEKSEAKPGQKRPGPPEGHVGFSHDDKPTMPDRHFKLSTHNCHCGGRLGRFTTIVKMVRGLDGSFHPQCHMEYIEKGTCLTCGAEVLATASALPGTSLEPLVLGIILMLYDIGATDAQISKFLDAVFGFSISPNTVWNARKALALFLERAVMMRIINRIRHHPWGQIDDTVFKRGDGKFGHVWVASTPEATFAWFDPSRAGEVLEARFSWMRDLPVVTDGLMQQRTFFKVKQRCRVHINRDAEELAIKQGGSYVDLYDLQLEDYTNSKKVKTLAPFTIYERSRAMLRIAASYDNEFQGYLMRALPDMYTALAFPGMPLHNNDVEREIRDGIIPQRNSRHQLVNADGRRIFSRIITFIRTCYKQGISPARALVELLQNPDWDLFEEAKNTPYSLVGPEGLAYSVFDGPQTVETAPILANPSWEDIEQKCVSPKIVTGAPICA